jgi:hypothetical protein
LHAAKVLDDVSHDEQRCLGVRCDAHRGSR